jgi:hypothetical protein
MRDKWRKKRMRRLKRKRRKSRKGKWGGWRGAACILRRDLLFGCYLRCAVEKRGVSGERSSDARSLVLFAKQMMHYQIHKLWKYIFFSEASAMGQREESDCFLFVIYCSTCEKKSYTFRASWLHVLKLNKGALFK